MGMKNRDEVIKQFENFYLNYIPTCEIDEYHDTLFKNVLALLKEQEGAEPIFDCEKPF